MAIAAEVQDVMFPMIKRAYLVISGVDDGTQVSGGVPFALIPFGGIVKVG